jgi:hypothetical protein
MASWVADAGRQVFILLAVVAGPHTAGVCGELKTKPGRNNPELLQITVDFVGFEGDIKCGGNSTETLASVGNYTVRGFLGGTHAEFYFDAGDVNSKMCGNCRNYLYDDGGHNVVANQFGNIDGKYFAKFGCWGDANFEVYELFGNWEGDSPKTAGHIVYGMSWLALLISRLAGNTVKHDYLRACRIGEASHPGPGGSRRTNRKRRRRNNDLETDGGGFEEMIRKIITKVKEMMQGQLSSMLKKTFGKAFGNGANDEDSEEEEAPPPKTPRRDKEQAKSKGKGDRAPAGATPPAKAKDTEKPDANGKGKGKDTPKAAGKGKGDSAAKAKGKGKDKGDKDKPPKADKDDDVEMTWAERTRRAQQNRDDEGFTQVRPALRASDWDADVLTVKTIEEHDGKTPLRGVIDIQDEEGPYARALLDNTTMDCAILMLERVKKPAKDDEVLKVAYKCKGGIKILTAVGKQILRGTTLTIPKLKAAQAKVMIEPPPTTSVLRVVFDSRYLDKDHFEKLIKKPKAETEKILASWGSRLIDTWGYAVELKGQHRICTGLLRVAEKNKKTVLGKSGQDGIVIDMMPGDSLAKELTTQWIPTTVGESPVEYFKRVANMGSPMGVTAGSRQLGIRRMRVEGEAIAASWVIRAVPREWQEQQLRKALGSAFKDTELQLQRRADRGRTANWYFRAAHDQEAIALSVQCGDSMTQLWCTRVTGMKKKPPTEVKPIKTPNTTNFKTEFAVIETRHTTTKQGETKDEDGKEGVAPKRKKEEASVMTRKLPDGCQIEAIAKDGNCLFAAVAAALTDLGGSGAGDTHREVRGRCAAWMRLDKTDKYNSVYASAGMTKDQYIEKMSKGGTWGGAPEIVCMCDFYQCSIFVVPMNHSSPIFRFGDQHTSRKIALWYTGTHYDRLKPQEEHWNLMKSPTTGTVMTECTGGGDTPPESRASGSGGPEDRRRRRRVHSARAADRADVQEAAPASASGPAPSQ